MEGALQGFDILLFQDKYLHSLDGELRSDVEMIRNGANMDYTLLYFNGVSRRLPLLPLLGQPYLRVRTGALP